MKERHDISHLNNSNIRLYYAINKCIIHRCEYLTILSLLYYKYKEPSDQKEVQSK